MLALFLQLLVGKVQTMRSESENLSDEPSPSPGIELAVRKAAQRLKVLSSAPRLQVFRLIAMHPRGLAARELRQHFPLRHLGIHLKHLKTEQLIETITCDDDQGYQVNKAVFYGLFAILGLHIQEAATGVTPTHLPFPLRSQQ